MRDAGWARRSYRRGAEENGGEYANNTRKAGCQLISSVKLVRSSALEGEGLRRGVNLLIL